MACAAFFATEEEVPDNGCNYHCHRGQPQPQPALTAPLPGSDSGQVLVLGGELDDFGCELRLDGELLGATPLTAELSAGEYDLELRREGFLSHRSRLSVPAGEPARQLGPSPLSRRCSAPVS